MALKGTIRTVSLAVILQLHCHENKSGALPVSHPDCKTEYQIFYLDGAIIDAIESKKTRGWDRC